MIIKKNFYIIQQWKEVLFIYLLFYLILFIYLFLGMRYKTQELLDLERDMNDAKREVNNINNIINNKIIKIRQ